MKTLTWIRLKFVAAIGTAALLAGGVAIVAIAQTRVNDKLTPQEIAKESQDAYAALTAYSDSGTQVMEIAGRNVETAFNIRLARPDLYRIDWSNSMSGSLSSVQGVAWSDGSGDYIQFGTGAKKEMKDMITALGSISLMGNSAIAVPEVFFNLTMGDPMGNIVAGKVETKIEGSIVITGKVESKREKDGRVGDVDCYVIRSVMDNVKMGAEKTMPVELGKMRMPTSTQLFWIGKHDHLIHQIQTSVDFGSTTSTPPPRLTDDDIKKLLERENKPVTAEAIADTRNRLEALSKKTQGVMKGKMVVTETHENIVVNQNFSPADFAP